MYKSEHIKLEPIYVNDEKYYANLSFDIDDFIGDGVWWLQIYNDSRVLIYDEPFASSYGKINIQRIRKKVKNEIQFFLCHHNES